MGPAPVPDRARGWTFLTNHAHVLLCLAADPDVLLRDVAARVGVTERAAQLIVADLEGAGYITRTRVGRRNHYAIQTRGRLRHPLESHRTIQVLLDIVEPSGVITTELPDSSRAPHGS